MFGVLLCISVTSLKIEFRLSLTFSVLGLCYIKQVPQCLSRDTYCDIDP